MPNEKVLGKDKFWWLSNEEGRVFVYVRSGRTPNSDRGSKMAKKSRGKETGRMTLYSWVTQIDIYSQMPNNKGLVIHFHSAEDKPVVVSLEHFDWARSAMSKSLKTDQMDNTTFKMNYDKEWVVASSDLEEEGEMIDNNESQTSPQMPTILNLDKLRTTKRKIATMKIPSAPKKPRGDSEQNLSGKFIGHFKVNIGALLLARTGSGDNIRKIDDRWLATLKSRLMTEATEDYQPLLLNTKTTKSDFKEVNVNGYKYEVLGGQHLALSFRDLKEEFPNEEKFNNLWGNLYSNLTEEEALLASDAHNKCGDFRKKRTFHDKVTFCRDWRNQFNTSQEWKASCRKINCNDKASIEIAMKIASFEDDEFALFQEVMALYENGSTKEQRLKEADLKMGKPDIAPSTFVNLVALHHDDVMGLLKGITKGEISMNELVKRAKDLKQLQSIKKSFMWMVNITTWDEATRRDGWQEVTTEEYLLKRWPPGKGNGFCGEKVPLTFKSFIKDLMEPQAAMSGQQCNVSVLQLEVDELRPCVANGVNLVMCMGDDVSHLKKVEESIRAINISHGIASYAMLVICANIKHAYLAQCQMKEENWTAVEVAFWNDVTVSRDQSKGTNEKRGILDACVTPVVIGHWTQTGKLSEIQGKFSGGELTNMWQAEGATEFFKTALRTLSGPEDTVVIVNLNGPATLAAVEQGRQTISIVKDQEDVQEVNILLQTARSLVQEE